MTPEHMKLTEALSELKILDKRITAELASAQFCAVSKHALRVMNGKKIEDVKSDMQAAYDKISALIARNNAIKKALTLANATVRINVNGMEMTIAEAIYYKTTGIAYEELLLENMSKQYNNAVALINRENGDKLNTNCETYLTNLYGAKETRPTTDEIETAKKNYLEANTADLIQGIDTKKTIEQLRDKIDKFKAEIDSAITIANATNEIEITY